MKSKYGDMPVIRPVVNQAYRDGDIDASEFSMLQDVIGFANRLRAIKPDTESVSILYLWRHLVYHLSPRSFHLGEPEEFGYLSDNQREKLDRMVHKIVERMPQDVINERNRVVQSITHQQDQQAS